MKILIIFTILCFNMFSSNLKLVEEVPEDIKKFYLYKDYEKKDYLLGASFFATAFILTNFDEKIKDFKDKNENESFDKVFPLFRKFGEFYPPLILMTLGSINNNEKAFRTGFYSAEASLLGLGITFAGKNLFARARPYMNLGADSWGNERFNDHYSSFPSGHSTVAFATATVIAESYKDKEYIPELMYTLATLAALSRVYDDKHWFSDIFLGSSIGYFSGKLLLKLKNEDKFISPYTDGESYGLSVIGRF